MPLFKNIGGGITGAFCVTMLAWALQLWQREAHGRQLRRSKALAPQSNSDPRQLCTLTPAAVKMLVELDPFPHRLIEVVSGLQDIRMGLPADLSSRAIRVEEKGYLSLFGSSERWGLGAVPHKSCLLVIAAPTQQEARRLACFAAAAGYQRCACVFTEGVEPGAWSRLATLSNISRQAVAAVLQARQKHDLGNLSSPVVLLDVRRPDERALYGSLQGSVHIPVEALPAALALPPDEFREEHGFDKPSHEHVMVVYSRGGQRALWAAQVCENAQLSRVLVYKEGTYGWRMDSSVKTYRSYALGAAPPDPEIWPVEAYDLEAGRQELSRMGLLGAHCE